MFLKNLFKNLQPKKVEKKTPFTSTKTFTLLKGLEGWKTTPYILNNVKSLDPYKHKSGLTVGAGFDLGQHTVASLQKMGLPSSFIKKCSDSGFLGVNPDTLSDNRVKGHKMMVTMYNEAKYDNRLPVFSDEELSDLAKVIYKPYEDSARRQYDRIFGEGQFDSKSEEVRALLSLEMYHRGTGIKFNEIMLQGAFDNDPMEVASGIKWKSRRQNAIYILNKLNVA